MLMLHTLTVIAAVATDVPNVATTGAFAPTQAARSSDHSPCTGRAVRDARITTNVISELATAKGVRSTDITAGTADGAVALTGVPATWTDVREAVSAAEAIKAVCDIDASVLEVEGRTRSHQYGLKRIARRRSGGIGWSTT